MSGVADELFADLAELDEEEQEYEEDEQGATENANGAEKDADGDEDMSDLEEENTEGPNALDDKGVMPGGVQPAEQLDLEALQRMDLGNFKDVSKVAKLYGSKRMNEIVKVRRCEFQPFNALNNGLYYRISTITLHNLAP
jgi:U4/U6 small nuclear ribonucleoprotein PRP31